MKIIVKVKKMEDGKKYSINSGQFHRLKGSKILWPIRSSVGGYTNEDRHIKSGREFYEIDLPLGQGAEIVEE